MAVTVKWVLPLSVLLVLSVLLCSRDWIFDTLQIATTNWQPVDGSDLRGGGNASEWMQEANSYFLDEGDAEVRECREYRSSYNRSYGDWLSLGTNASDEEVLCAAHHAATRPMAAGGQPRVAFLFLVLGM